jgi:hypothetical protein
MGCEMEDPLRSAERHRSIDGVSVGDIAAMDDELAVHADEAPRCVSWAQDDVGLVTVANKPSGKVRTDEPAGAGDESTRHRRRKP